VNEGGSDRDHNPQDERQKGAHTHSPSVRISRKIDWNCGHNRVGIPPSSYLGFL
jgi:hypothetical protein